MDEEAIKKRIEQLVAEANRQIGMRQGAIAELERMLKEQPE